MSENTDNISCDDSIDIVRLITRTANIPVDPVACEVADLPPGITRAVRSKMMVKACYNNAFHAVGAMNARGLAARYVLGYWTPLIPVEHAWVECDGRWHDPTRELVLAPRDTVYLNGGHFPLALLTMRELLDVMAALGSRQAPDLCDVRRGRVRLGLTTPWYCGVPGGRRPGEEP